jgi:molecular chaperone GrpE
MDTVQNNGPESTNDSSDTSSSVDSTAAQLEKLRDEAKSFQDKYLRQVAELENYRRRSEREKADLLKFGIEGLVRDMIPVLDSFQQAIPSRESDHPAALEGLINGIEMVKQQLLAALRKHGLEEVPAVGTKFDPNVHQAIQRIESTECDSEVVAQEFARGYLLNGRLVRPAMVSVNVPRG